MRAVLFLPIYFCTGQLFADVFQCVNENDQIIYTDNREECSNPVEIDIQTTQQESIKEDASNSNSIDVIDSSIDVGDEPGVDLISSRGTTIAIDGVMEDREWKHVTPYVFKIKTAMNREQDLFFYVMNDSDTLYIAIKFSLPAYVSRQSLFITLDQKFLGTYYEGQDLLGLSPQENGRHTYYDELRTLMPPCPDKYKGTQHKYWCAFEDTKLGGTTDGEGSYGVHDQTAIYEFAKPLRNGDADHDMQVEMGEIVGLRAELRFIINNASYEDHYLPGPTHEDNITVRITDSL